MKVILNKTVIKVGKAGDVKNVSDGFARNYLLPRKLAVIYSDGAVKSFEKRKTKLDESNKGLEKDAQKWKQKLEEVKLEFPVLVDGKGDLYGSISKGQILKALKTKGVELPETSRFNLREPVKRLGDFEVSVDLFTGVTAKVRGTVTRQETSK